MTGLLLLVLAATDPCTAPIVPAPGGGQEAAIYLRVGDAERDRGNLGAAREAYREALARAPGSVEALARLQAVCAPTPDPFQAGVEALESGRPDEALPLFAASRGRGNDRAVDLLEGISRYQLGEDARAVPLLESARADPALAESAAFFLGLVALRRGDGDRATRLFDQAGQATGLEDAARQLSRMAQVEGHLVLSAATEVLYDTNAALRPDGAPTTLPGPDGSVGVTLMALVRPWGTPGPYARVEGQFSKQFTLTALDLIGGAGALGFKLLGPTASFTAEYAYGVQAIDGRGYLGDQRIFLGGSLLTGNFLWGAAYAGHLESYRWSGLTDLSGLRQVLELDAGYLPGGGVRLTAGWVGTWDAAQKEWLSYLEHGPILEVLWARGPLTLGARGSIAWRTYRTEDPAYGAVRDDTRYAGTTWLDVALGIQWALRGAVRFLRVDSNIPDLNATEWVFSTSLIWTAAVL